jgi:hypothetical protein
VKEDDVPLVALQKVKEAAPLVSVPEAVDVEAEKEQARRSGLTHGLHWPPVPAGRRCWGALNASAPGEFCAPPAAALAASPAAEPTIHRIGGNDGIDVVYGGAHP